MIQEAYCSFETSKLLKEKGFSINLPEKWYNIDTDKPFPCSIGRKGCLPCPTQQMAMRWLREVHNWNVVIRKSHTIYGYDIYIESLVASNVIECAFEKTYEKACETAIKYCLENLI